MSGRHEAWEADEGHQELAGAPLQGMVEAKLEQLKAQMLAPMLENAKGTPLAKELYCAANEAAALAWLTVCPLLFFPGLLEEKVRTALRRWERQKSTYQSTLVPMECH